MTTLQTGREHHTFAIDHHIKAVECHWEASEYCQKDYAHAAYQALLAHGHTLVAVIHGNKASKYYGECDCEALRKNPYPPPRIPAQSLEAAETLGPPLSAAWHHKAAAEHHNEAARHHGRACNHFDRKRYALAAQESKIAYSHSQSALFHGNEAAMRHIDQHGNSNLNASPTDLPSESIPGVCAKPVDDDSEKVAAPRSNVLHFFTPHKAMPVTR
jgi:hypothetical protein